MSAPKVTNAFFSLWKQDNRRKYNNKTFGLTKLEKGYFPHFFNRAENQDYVGPMPDVKYYDPNGMSPDDRKKFFAWYKDRVEHHHEFDFPAEILRYCQSDVDIIRRCCLEFRELFCQITDVDPFASCLTIASACNLVFRKTFLEEDTIAIIPPCGYKPENRYSVIAMKILTWISQRDNIGIRHACNQGEKRIGKYLVDRFNEESNKVWEIHGCLWHGCEQCFSGDTVNPVNHLSMHDLRQSMLEKTHYLRENGYNVIEIWTCDIERELAMDSEMKEFFDNFEISKPLEPRQAFFGGRTNATRLYHEARDDEKIRYVDFCSLSLVSMFLIALAKKLYCLLTFSSNFKVQQIRGISDWTPRNNH
jgi:G:T-mismatch repair DNA endonuclease (very short patch repair protein)